MPKVAVLPDHIASQIAAGEVVERPSSVVKELLENAIDAGATHIEITVSNASRDIRVADDGCGMLAEDAVLAFQRHATSKISCADDLQHLATLGFRGEALPSIASISKFSCTTRTREMEAGTRVEVHSGEISAVETGCSVGTIMDVRDLFYNVPARLKFLKSASTEFAHIQEIVQSLAVANPAVMVELKKDSSSSFKTTGSGSIKQAAIESKLFSGKESLIEFSGEDFESGMKVTGLVARPTHFRGDRKGILTVVNNRPVRCPLTYRALDYAYSDLIPRGKSPFAVVIIGIDPAQVDVNIHPTKKEIKYASGNNVYMALHRTIGNALRQPRSDLIRSLPGGSNFASTGDDTTATFAPSHSQTRSFLPPAVEKPESSDSLAFNPPGDEHQFTQVETVLALDTRFSLDPAAPPVVEEQQQLSLDIGSVKEEHFHYATPSEKPPDPVPAPATFRPQDQQLTFSRDISFQPKLEDTPKATDAPGYFSSQDLEAEVSLPIGWRLAGYIHNTYFLFETPDGIEIVEQHIAHERYLYERILSGQNIPGQISDYAQTLIISAPLSLTASQVETLKECRASLQMLGFDFEDEGDEICCTQVPLQLAHHDYASIIQTMLDEVSQSNQTNFALEATKSLACQSAIKNGMHLSENDILRLVSAWLKTERNDTCPHGRPIRLKFSKDKLFQLFHP